jgi:tetratricopeptide (TPR) repeat protein
MRVSQPSTQSGYRPCGLTAGRRLARALACTGGALALAVSSAGRALADDAEAPGRARSPGVEPSSGAVAAPPEPLANDRLRGAQRLLLERAKERYEAGRRAGSDGRPHLERALDALDLAYRLAPAPWLLFNMAQVQSQLGACSAAADLYQRFLASQPSPEAKRSAEAALALLGACEASDAEQPTSEALQPGLRLPTSFDSIFAARGVASPATPAASPTVHAEPDAGGNARTVLPWAFGSLAVISGVAGAIYWSEARSAKRDFDRIRIAGPEVARTQQRGESAQELARVFGGVAVGFALATGASYWWVQADAEQAPLVAALERVSWLSLAGGGGAVYRSEF